MNRSTILLVLSLMNPIAAHAGHSVIVDSEGYACMGEDKSRKQTEQVALQDCKRKATEQASTYLVSETRVKDAVMEKDLVSAYANARVTVVKELLREWYKDRASGDCFRVKLKMEVVPDERKLAVLETGREDPENDPLAPLSVRIWTDRPAYADRDCMRIYLKGNKPFYGRVIYSQADGSQVQLLPNPYRKLNYFNGGTIYEVSGGERRICLEACPPFGTERITLYAATAPLEGEKGRVLNGGKVGTDSGTVATAISGAKVVADGQRRSNGAEFTEAVVELKTVQR